jgi:hypothetical protein
MRSIQEKLTSQISAAIEAEGLEGVVASSFGNMGDIHVQDRESYETLMTITYDFQADSCEFSITVKGEKIPSQSNRTGYYAFYQKYTDTPGLTNFFITLGMALDISRK